MNDNIQERIRVIVIADSPVARASLEAAADGDGRFEVVGSSSAASSGHMLDSTGAEAVLMDSRTFSSWQPGSDRPPKIPPAPLTPREVEVLSMMSDGASNKVIAWKLGISDHTAKFHVASILSKLNAGSRTEAVTLGVRQGLIYL